jgi:hypothetical protein
MGDFHGAFPPGTVASLPETFRCPLCGQTCKVRGFTRHLTGCCKKAGLTLADYERLHPMDLYSPVHQFAAKWFSLARFSLSEFGLMDYGGCYWCHIDAAHPQPWYSNTYGRKAETLPLLTFKDGQAQLKRAFHHFRRHLHGDLTLGIWPEMDNRVLVIDLDEHAAQHRNNLMQRLIDLHLHFYIEFSGQKVFHFWIFWDRMLPQAQLIRLHECLCDGIPTDHKLWPFQRSLIKLPLGLHRRTNQLACFLDYRGEPIPLNEQFTYCLSMRDNPVPRALYEAANSIEVPADTEIADCTTATTERVAHKAKMSQHSLLASEYELCLTTGSKLPDGRHHTLFLLAIYLRDKRRVSQAEASAILLDWSHRVPSRQTFVKRLHDVHETVRKVYEHKTYESGVLQSVLTENEKQIIEFVCVSSIIPVLGFVGSSGGRVCPESEKSVCVSSIIPVHGFVGSPLRKGDVTKRLRTAKKVALVMASVAKANGGWIEIGYGGLMKEAGISKQALRRALDLLVADVVPVDPANLDEHDEVLWNLDQRPARRGSVFVCVNRGSFPQYDRSLYRLSAALLDQLGWPACDPDQLAQRQVCSGWTAP